MDEIKWIPINKNCKSLQLNEFKEYLDKSIIEFFGINLENKNGEKD